jgi:5-methylcytosine-specific restriction endonuclease McrA
MKIQVSDAAVADYAARLRARLPLGNLFPARMSDCDFTEGQRQVIRQARADRRSSQKSGGDHPETALPTNKQTKVRSLGEAPAPEPRKPKPLSKLRKMLYLQSGRCFFCGETLKEEDASIEHLNPKSRGGTSTEDNQVVCHASLNETFGAMALKEKFGFVLRSAGSFRCPAIPGTKREA